MKIVYTSNKMKKNRVYFIVVLVVIVFLIVFFSIGRPGDETETILVPVEYGTFEIDVTTTGELEAKESEDIKGPPNLRTVRIWQVTIEDIIPDGTIVDSGDYVATLDRTELENKIKDEELELENLETQFVKTKLDTTMELRAARDELVNLKYNLEEMQIIVDQSIYEPPATQRQAKINLDKAKRAYSQAVENYQLKMQKAEANMQEVATDMKKVKNQLENQREILKGFIVKAPKPGMVNYRRGWDGKKMGVGSQIGSWDPVVATLPNLKEMNSKTYVNEIDISKVKAGQFVEIEVDAFPDKSYTGSVTEVANIGQQLNNSNAKVFEVIIEVNEYDSILRPAMTTKNRIISNIIDSVMYIPIECIQSNDSISYVYTPSARKQVITGESNENEIIIYEGLKKNEKVYLVAPENAEEKKLILLDTSITNKYLVPDVQTDNTDTLKSEKEVEETMKKQKGGESGKKFTRRRK